MALGIREASFLLESQQARNPSLLLHAQILAERNVSFSGLRYVNPSQLFVTPKMIELDLIISEDGHPGFDDIDGRIQPGIEYDFIDSISLTGTDYTGYYVLRSQKIQLGRISALARQHSERRTIPVNAKGDCFIRILKTEFSFIVRR